MLYWFHARPLNFIIYLIVWRCWVCIGQIIFQVHVVVKENRRRISLQTLPGVEAILHKDIAKIYRLSFHKFYITLSLLITLWKPILNLQEWLNGSGWMYVSEIWQLITTSYVGTNTNTDLFDISFGFFRWMYFCLLLESMVKGVLFFSFSVSGL